YYPWGQLWQNNGYGWDARFASLPTFDYDLNLDETLFRLYAPAQSRWMSPDPLAGDILNPQSLNRYAYVTNNPTSMIDPLGLQSGSSNIPWSGNCTPNGYTATGCYWGGGTRSDTYNTYEFLCIAGEFAC